MILKPKVLFLIDTLNSGGAEKSLVEMAIKFKDITPVFLHVYKGEFLKDILIKNGIKVISLNLEGKYRFNKAKNEILRIIDEIKPDVIHSTLIRSDLISRKLKSKIYIPLINSFVSNSYKKERYQKLSLLRKLKLRYIEFLDKRSASKVDLFISNSKNIAKDNSKVLNLSADKIVVIPRGRDINLFNISTERIKEKRNELKIGNKRVLLNVGRLIESKGQLDLIMAYSNVVVHFPNTVLLIAGEGPLRNQLEVEIKKLKLDGNIKLLGNRLDVPELLALSEIFIFPSYVEGMSGSLIEAMMSKTNILASDIPENVECFPPSINQFFEKGNIQEMESAILSYLENTGNYKNGILEEMFNYSLENFEINKVVAQYERVYKSLSLTQK